ncbi:hypothetical protein NPX13_g1926 [Xylaria arbuscula]|uniref:Uncharacterized protein n=1 Tax=Xylaria arbuscula TaxID=114810 RepID=A0A9W8TQW2_9PEZI|nr:hypothetical protein NPX13_g1926 [Xylaria arbuscula]
MGWWDSLWASSTSADDPLRKLDPKLREFLEKESPVKYTSSSGNAQQEPQKPSSSDASSKSSAQGEPVPGWPLRAPVEVVSAARGARGRDQDRPREIDGCPGGIQGAQGADWPGGARELRPRAGGLAQLHDESVVERSHDHVSGASQEVRAVLHDTNGAFPAALVQWLNATVPGYTP